MQGNKRGKSRRIGAKWFWHNLTPCLCFVSYEHLMKCSSHEFNVSTFYFKEMNWVFVKMMLCIAESHLDILQSLAARGILRQCNRILASHLLNHPAKIFLSNVTYIWKIPKALGKAARFVHAWWVFFLEAWFIQACFEVSNFAGIFS